MLSSWENWDRVFGGPKFEKRKDHHKIILKNDARNGNKVPDFWGQNLSIYGTK